MFNWIRNGSVNTKKIQETDQPFYATEEKKKQILRRKMQQDKNFSMQSRKVSLNDSFSDSWLQIQAENRVYMEQMKKSYLWSPQITPRFAKNHLLYPLLFAFGFAFYCHQIQGPKNMMKLKKKYGAVFLRNESAGTFTKWTQDEYVDEIYGDIFQKQERDVYDQQYQALETKEREFDQGKDEYKKLLGHEFEKLAFKKQMTSQLIKNKLNSKLIITSIFLTVWLRFRHYSHFQKSSTQKSSCSRQREKSLEF